MSSPRLYRQLQAQLSQWICPQDQRHLQIFCENVAAILQAQSSCLSHWLLYLSHRDCQARSHMERLNYFIYDRGLFSLGGCSIPLGQTVLEHGSATVGFEDYCPAFEVYRQRFGGIEPHFEDYKSAAFELIRSHLRDPQALNCLLMLLASATLVAIAIAMVVVSKGRRNQLD